MMKYARIQNGVVANLFTPPLGTPPIAEMFHPDLVWVDCTATSGVAEGWTYDGHSFAAPVVAPPPAPTVQQQAMALLGGLVTVQCVSVPALSGAYPIDSATQMQITGIAAAISAGLGLPGGGGTFNWPDAGGTAHPWPASQFTAYAKGVMNFVYACAQVAQGHGTTLPSTTLPIA